MGRARVLVVGVLLLALAGCTGSSRPGALSPPQGAGSAGRWDDELTGVPTPLPPLVHTVVHHRPSAYALRSYGDCTQLLAGLKKEALSEVTAYGLGDEPIAMPGGVAVGMAAAAPAAGTSAGTAEPTTAGGAGTAYSTTNNQEAGVDEPDSAKTDGHLLVVARSGPVGLEVLDVNGGSAKHTSWLPVPELGDVQVFLDGEDAILLGTASTDTQVSTRVVVVSLADSSHPHVVRRFTVSGSLTSSRLVAGRLLLVTQQLPNLPFVGPQGSTQQDTNAALRHNRNVIRSTKLRDWLPRVTSSGHRRPWMPDCQNTLHPSTASGVGMLSLVSLDPTSDAQGHQVTVVGTGSVVYASTNALYVATTDWADQQVIATGRAGAVHTDIHGFDLTDPAQPAYIGSGHLLGTLVGQYAMSEYAGDLRVATTVGEATAPPGEGYAPKVLSDNRVTVLRPVDGTLVAVGSVGGLGRGEKIYGVRFVGALGYVVTFRQTDPLYVVDLTQPTRPRVRGALKLTGYSAYLHPLGDGLLLGLGESVDARVARTGLQLSVFSVGDPAHPTLRSRLRLTGAQSDAEYDPHAFLWWAPDRVVVIPVVDPSGQNGAASVDVFHVGRFGFLKKVGTVSQPSSQTQSNDTCCWWPATIQRSLVVGNVLYTVSTTGVMANDLHTLTRQAWVPFS